MFDSLQKRWKVSGLRLTLIILTFAIGGSLTGYVGKKLMNLLAIQQDWLWTLIYIALITLLWPLAVILVSIPFGQFPFFRRYLKRMGARMGMGNKRTVHIAIFASGAGSNAQKIIDHFRNNKQIRVSLIVTNNPDAAVLNIAGRERIPTFVIEKERFFRGDGYLDELQNAGIDLIVLAGFLWKVPALLIKKYDGRIINIHPALLPKYGGKGMYGANVHGAVLNAKEKQSGISIHYVNDIYDNGKLIYQAACPVYENDTVESLSQRIHLLEHEHYPRVVEEVALLVARR
jgi:formyltetrahydrofolate-dependent phosphoribosylglycinamide formyltransferase